MSAAEMGMAEMMDDHEQMSCCTPDCATATAAAAVIEPSVAAGAEWLAASTRIDPLAYEALHSINPSAADPPPRLSFV